MGCVCIVDRFLVGIAAEQRCGIQGDKDHAGREVAQDWRSGHHLEGILGGFQVLQMARWRRSEPGGAMA